MAVQRVSMQIPLPGQVENSFGAEEKTSRKKDTLVVEELIGTAFEKSMALLENLDLEKKSESEAKFTINEFLASNHKLLPLLNLLDDRSVAYIQEFDKIVQEIIQERDAKS